MSNQDIKEVQELVTLLHDSADFYKEARMKVSNVNLKATFEEMATIKEQLVNDLQPLIVMEAGQIDDGHNIAVKVRQMYTNILASMQKDKSETFINNLEEVEDKTRQKAREAIKAAVGPEVIAVLQEAYPKIERCHDRMSRLKAAHA
jgi:uncharacterized protein (TIGR02284 family)